MQPKRPSLEPSAPNDPWRKDPELIRRFLENRDDFQQLCGEIAYILRRRTTKANIEVASITHRAKTLNSFLEKITRKHYADPLTEVTDFAGVRVVCLYSSDLAEVEKIIRSDFNVRERVDKIEELEIDRFGYGAIHFIVNLGEKSSGARYDDLKHLVCEVQVRTVLQDAWAIIQHHLVYKTESDVPRSVRRKLNSLAGLLETADDQFLQVRNERKNYVTAVRQSQKRPEVFLDNELNLDSFREYIAWKFPELQGESAEGLASTVLRTITDRLGITTLRALDEAVQETDESRKAALEDLFASGALLQKRHSAAIELMLAAFLADPERINLESWPITWRSTLEKYKASHPSGKKPRKRESAV